LTFRRGKFGGDDEWETWSRAALERPGPWPTNVTSPNTRNRYNNGYV
jgi:hypothetical protein